MLVHLVYLQDWVETVLHHLLEVVAAEVLLLEGLLQEVGDNSLLLR